MFTVDLSKDDLKLNTQILNPECEDTIILTHGMFGNLSQFYLTLAPFLAREYRVVMYDLRSHGRSSKHSTGYDLTTLSGDVALLMDALEIKKAHLLGFSYGALIALKFAMRFKHRVKKVIAVEVPPKPLTDFKNKGTYSFDDFLGFVYTLTPSVRDNFLRSERQIKNTFNMYEYIFNKTTFVDDMNNEKEFDFQDYSSLQSPVQLFFGSSSICIPELNRISDWINDKVVSFEEGDHGFFMHRPIETSNKMIEFLKTEIRVTA